jgi:hypothetical protein
LPLANGDIFSRKPICIKYLVKVFCAPQQGRFAALAGGNSAEQGANRVEIRSGIPPSYLGAMIPLDFDAKMAKFTQPAGCRRVRVIEVQNLTNGATC